MYKKLTMKKYEKQTETTKQQVEILNSWSTKCMYF